MRHVGRKKEKKEAKGKGGSAKEELKKRKWLKQSQDKWLVFNVTECEECEREKRRKGERNKRVEAIRPFGQRKKRSEVPKVW